MSIKRKIGSYLVNKAKIGMEYQNEDTVKKLIKDAKSSDPKLTVAVNPEFGNSAYLGINQSLWGPLKKNLYNQLIKAGYSKREALKKVQQLQDQAAGSLGIPKANRELFGKHAVLMGIGRGNPGTVAHELGHATSGNSKLGRAYQIGYIGSSIPQRMIDRTANSHRLGHAVIAANAAHSGYLAGKAKAKGKKLSWWKKHKAWMLPALIDAPRLAEEGRASLVGMHKLHKVGASKADLRNARKTLGLAYGTYMVDPALRLANSGVSYYLAKKLAEKKYRESHDE